MVQYRPAATGVQVSAVHPQQNWMQTLESCTLIKDQPTKRHVTLQHVQVLPLLNHHSWKQLGFKNHCTVCEMFCGDFVQHVIYIYFNCWFCGCDKVAFYTYTYRISIYRIRITDHYIYIYMCVCVCGHTGSCCTHCVHVLAIGLVEQLPDISVAVLLTTQFT